MEIDKKNWENKSEYFSNPVIVLIAPPSSVTIQEVQSLEAAQDFNLDSPSVLLSASNEPSVTSCEHNINTNQALSEATDKLKKLARGVRVHEVPRGEPLFMFCTIPGKTRDLVTFFDLGCSHVVFRSSVPQYELEAVKTKAGPLYMGAAGDVTVMVETRSPLPSR